MRMAFLLTFSAVHDFDYSEVLTLTKIVLNILMYAFQETMGRVCHSNGVIKKREVIKMMLFISIVI